MKTGQLLRKIKIYVYFLVMLFFANFFLFYCTQSLRKVPTDQNKILHLEIFIQFTILTIF